MKNLRTYIFTDILTNETFTITCKPYQIHNIENINLELFRWCQGRIINRIEI